MFKVWKVSGLLVAVLWLSAVQAQTKIELQLNKPGPKIQPTMWGIFFEDINFAADGGLYAELVKNRSFAFDDPLMGWKSYRKDSLRIINETGASTASRFVRLLPLKSSQKNFLQNEGFRGMGFSEGEEYRLTVNARVPEGNEQELKVELLGDDKKPVAESVVTIDSNDWGKKELILKAQATAAKGSLKISVVENGSVDFKFISLFPVKTFKNRPNGMRLDLAEKLAALKPGFVRFPGGCIVEGHHLDLRYQWKKTVGNTEDRETLINRWNTEFRHRFTPDYYQSFGLGFYEYFQLAEDLGAEALPILNCGMACQYNTGELAPLNEMEPYISDALDLIEFANGDATSTWGKLRAEMGHPEPFNLKYLGIGNEQWGEQYLERYDIIAEKVHEKYPEIELVSGSGPSSDGDQFEYLWKELKSRTANLVDEHYYKDPNWFFNNAKRYDNYERGGLKVFAGEYASHTRVENQDPSSNNNWLAALSEAAFMTGLERNADVVQMASYAPLLAHVDAWQWRPDLIWFDNLKSVKTPNYYVQQMYSTHRGDYVVPVVSGGDVLAGQDSLYASASADQAAKKVYLKLVNSSAQSRAVSIALKGAKTASKEVTVTTLYQPDLMAYNSLPKPDVVVPQKSTASIKGSSLNLELKAQSFVLVELTTK
ncbi:alpha-L-arabinofuranosidase C-terminal domain-containing protein [Mangrovibacterium marinum]|uniref:non-reducing end alpha-L-arabinofuranosidase n=1 Tax=Mangrovibacterium marinum TaxID=1639118 RepID=A0A2T5C5G7_9BACT|nr:alpha-L-arabinofuranosidase C-terminal domain-containing protein [Mangrovibacterium marinum]PTN10145.1 alpha-N-arabinofuranosidase [Mangrovibacterium marinum]